MISTERPFTITYGPVSRHIEQACPAKHINNGLPTDCGLCRNTGRIHREILYPLPGEFVRIASTSRVANRELALVLDLQDVGNIPRLQVRTGYILKDDKIIDSGDANIYDVAVDEVTRLDKGIPQ